MEPFDPLENPQQQDPFRPLPGDPLDPLLDPFVKLDEPQPFDMLVPPLAPLRDLNQLFEMSKDQLDASFPGTTNSEAAIPPECKQIATEDEPMIESKSQPPFVDGGWNLDYGDPLPDEPLPHPELELQLKLRSYNTLSLKLPHYRVGAGSRVPPRHVKRHNLRRVSRREKCEECDRLADDFGSVYHGSSCSRARSCPECGGMNWKHQGQENICEDCGHAETA